MNWQIEFYKAAFLKLNNGFNISVLKEIFR